LVPETLRVPTRTLAVIALLCLSLTTACGASGGDHREPVTKLVAKEESATSQPTASQAPVLSCPSGYIALTFDDGPSPITPRFISYLTSQHVPATFFIVGSRMAYQVPIVRAEQRAGFAIGNHSWSHADLQRLSDAGIEQEIRSTAMQFRRFGIKPTNLVRPPYGAIDQRVDQVLTSMHMHPFQWTIDSEDWLSGDPKTIAGRVIAAVRPHHVNVVLMHDGLSGAVHGRVASEQTIGAVPIVVAWARQHGYCFTAPRQQGWSALIDHMPWYTPVAPDTTPGTKPGRHAGA
jgi:peptidoglycan/xylan/chitin deacetylase (PgdA/CDA1 family)